MPYHIEAETQISARTLSNDMVTAVVSCEVSFVMMFPLRKLSDLMKVVKMELQFPGTMT